MARVKWYYIAVCIVSSIGFVSGTTFDPLPGLLACIGIAVASASFVIFFFVKPLNKGGWRARRSLGFFLAFGMITSVFDFTFPSVLSYVITIGFLEIVGFIGLFLLNNPALMLGLEDDVKVPAIGPQRTKAFIAAKQPPKKPRPVSNTHVHDWQPHDVLDNWIRCSHCGEMHMEAGTVAAINQTAQRA